MAGGGPCVGARSLLPQVRGVLLACRRRFLRAGLASHGGPIRHRGRPFYRSDYCSSDGQALADPDVRPLARSSTRDSRSRRAVCLLLVLSLTFLPVPARAVSFSDFVNGGIANSAFGTALSVGTQNFTNYALYQIYQRLSLTRLTIIDGFELLHSDTGAISDYLYSINNKLSTANNHTSSLISNVSTILNSLKNSAGTAIQALQTSAGYLASMNYSAPDGNTYGLGSLLWLVRNSLSADGVIASRLDRLTDIQSALGPLLTVVSRLSGDGPIASRLDCLADIQSALGPLSTIVARLNGDGPISSRLDRLADIQSALGPLSTVVSRLTYSYDGDTYSASSLLFQIMQRLGADSVISNRLSGVIDGLDSSSSSIIDALGNVAITFPDSITATLSGDATISAETDVAGEAAQAGTLWDAIAGDVDLPQIQAQMDATVGVLRTSFPFGCIFVLSDALAALSAAPVAPVFAADLPAVSGTYHAEIDLSFFDSMASLWRGGMVVIYVAGLYSATKHWVFNGGGESA